MLKEDNHQGCLWSVGVLAYFHRLARQELRIDTKDL